MLLNIGDVKEQIESGALGKKAGEVGDSSLGLV